MAEAARAGAPGGGQRLDRATALSVALSVGFSLFFMMERKMLQGLRQRAEGTR